MNDITAKNLESFDLIIMNGLIHHLNDFQVIELFKHAKSILKPCGKIVTLDGCYVKSQSIIAKKLLDFDHGKYIREHKEYMSLASKVFDSVVAHIRHDMMLIPYTLIIMEIA